MAVVSIRQPSSAEGLDACMRAPGHSAEFSTPQSNLEDFKVKNVLNILNMHGTKAAFEIRKLIERGGSVTAKGIPFGVDVLKTALTRWEESMVSISTDSTITCSDSMGHARSLPSAFEGTPLASTGSTNVCSDSAVQSRPNVCSDSAVQSRQTPSASKGMEWTSTCSESMVDDRRSFVASGGMELRSRSPDSTVRAGKAPAASRGATLSSACSNSIANDRPVRAEQWQGSLRDARETPAGRRHAQDHVRSVSPSASNSTSTANTSASPAVADAATNGIYALFSAAVAARTQRADHGARQQSIDSRIGCAVQCTAGDSPLERRTSGKIESSTPVRQRLRRMSDQREHRVSECAAKDDARGRDHSVATSTPSDDCSPASSSTGPEFRTGVDAVVTGERGAATAMAEHAAGGAAAREVARILSLRRRAFRSHVTWGLAVLECGPGEQTVASVQRQYRARMRQLHPDKCGHVPQIGQAVDVVREAKEICVRRLSTLQAPDAPRNLKYEVICDSPGRRRVRLQWSAPEQRELAPVRRFVVAAFDPSYGKALTVTVLEPDYSEELRRFVTVEDLGSYVFAEDELEKMPSLFKQQTAELQVATANEVGQSRWAKIRVPLQAPAGTSGVGLARTRGPLQAAAGASRAWLASSRAKRVRCY